MADKYKRIVLKFGSGVLANPERTVLDKRQFRRLSGEVAELVERGHECVVVSSGAVAAGMRVLCLDERPADLPSVQACAAVGQSKLMQLYESMFAKHRISVAQLLLTHGDLDSRTRYLNAKNTLRRLLQCGRVVPIINENDSVAVEELRFGDNDRLSAEVAMLAEADLLILLTSVDGVLDSTGKVIPLVNDVDSIAGAVNSTKGKFSIGGMVSKLQAVKVALKAGIPAVIANGRRPGRIAAAVSERPAGTRFQPG
jgi:glutamate 5-kinase